MDAHIGWAVTLGLRQRGVTVLMAIEDGSNTLADPDLLDRAGALGHVLFTQDVDFLIEGARRQRAGEFFSGVIYAKQQVVSERCCIDDLELLAKAYDPPDMMNRVEYLPL